jgi:hypothetical protein
MMQRPSDVESLRAAVHSVRKKITANLVRPIDLTDS